MKYNVGNDFRGRDWVVVDIKTNKDLKAYMETYNYVEPVLDDEKEYDYDDALEYLEVKGINCYPWIDPTFEGSYVSDLLSDLFPDIDCGTCSKEDLDNIVNKVEDYRIDNQDAYEPDEE